MLPGSRRRYTHNSRSRQTAFVAVILSSYPPESLHRGTVTSDKLQLVVGSITTQLSRRHDKLKLIGHSPAHCRAPMRTADQPLQRIELLLLLPCNCLGSFDLFMLTQDQLLLL